MQKPQLLVQESRLLMCRKQLVFLQQIHLFLIYVYLDELSNTKVT